MLHPFVLATFLLFSNIMLDCLCHTFDALFVQEKLDKKNANPILHT